MYKILTKKNEEILIDLEDKDKALYINLVWWVNKGGYPVTKRKGKRIKIHNLIMNIDTTSDLQMVDHINGNKLDNRKSNLRICTKSQNSYNKQKQSKPTSSIYKGVSWCKVTKAWRAQVDYNLKPVIKKRFVSEIAAANAYNYYATQYHKEFASLNILLKQEQMSIEEWNSYMVTPERKLKYRGTRFSINKNNKTTWWSVIKNGSNYIDIGEYSTEIEAALAYNNFIIKYNINKKINKIESEVQ